MRAVVALAAAVRGAVAFLTRLPVGGSERSWDAFRATPVAFPLAAYLVGALAGAPLALPLPAPTAAAAYLLALYLLTGPTHADGLADVGDAAAVHGDAERRRAVLEDPAVGVGGTLALAVSLLTLALGAVALANLGGVGAFAVALAAEVGAKAGMALLVCLGTPAHEGMGARLAAASDGRALLPVALAALPALLVAPATGAPAAALASGPAVALLVRRWARPRIGGVSGDVFGAANELGRAVGLHAGAVTWALL